MRNASCVRIARAVAARARLLASGSPSHCLLSSVLVRAGGGGRRGVPVALGASQQSCGTATRRGEEKRRAKKWKKQEERREERDERHTRKNALIRALEHDATWHGTQRSALGGRAKEAPEFP